MKQHPSSSPSSAPFWKRAAASCGLALGLLAPTSAFAAFGLTTDATYFTVDTDAGLVFKVRRNDFGSSTQSPGDLASLVYNGVEYQNASRGSQVNSGFDWLYNGISAVDVQATTIGSDYVKVTVKGGDLTHYYIARRGQPYIYMATHILSEPSVHGLVRYIVRVPQARLPNGPTPSDIRNNVGAIESSDVFKLADGTTRSKHYSNMRLKDWSYIGATGDNVGLWIVRDNNEGGSGGPFYRCLLNQCGSDQEITYIANYGEVQTEAFRFGILNSYTMVFNNGTPPPTNIDKSFFADLDLVGYVAPSGRGSVTGSSITGRDGVHEYTVGFANAQAQYWAPASDVDGSFTCPDMLPGTYTMTVYKNELSVATRSVSVAAGQATDIGATAITNDPSSTTALWRIGDWDGSPAELLNGDKLTTMHPSDPRMASWVQPAYVIGTSTPSANFPAYSWKAVNNPITVKFNLTAEQIAAYTIKAGITIGYAGGRPQIKVNTWSSNIPSAPNEPKTRSLTVGSYRGNNVMYSYNVPASAFVVGENTLSLIVVSGSSGSVYLSPGCSYDAVEMAIQPPVIANAAASGNFGYAFSYQLAATNLPTSFGASGLPAGLSLDSATGLISGTPAQVGKFTVAVSATNANGTGNGTLTITITDITAPVLTLSDLVAEATGPDGAAVTLSGSALDDVDGALPVTFSPASGSVFAIGTTTVNASATDAAGNTGTGSFKVTVQDTTAPVITSLSASETVLTPANHQMRRVKLSADATDLVGVTSLKIISVQSNEAVNGEGDGDTSPDWEITGDLSLQLRAERSGTGDGRIYTITVEARDAAGNASIATVQVGVPHDASTE